MNRVLVWLVGIALSVVSAAPALSAKALDPLAYALVGEDPSGDGVLPLASGANWPACGTGFGCTKYDVVKLEVASDAENVHLKLTPAASYWGTGGVLYVVHFEAAGKKLYTCWAVHSVGLSNNPVDAADQENLVACSRFSGETQVGPATRAAGVESSTAAGNLFVDWPVPKASLGEGVPALTNVVAEIWARGPSNSNVGSTTHSHYLWNRGDRAPDAGEWIATLGAKASDLNLTLSAASPEVNATAGEAASFDLVAGLVGNGTANVTFNASGLPEGWEATFAPANASFSADSNSSAVGLNVTIPSDASNQTVNFTVLASGDGNLTASLNLTIHSRVPASRNETGANATATQDASGAAAAEGAEGGGIPAPSLIAALVLLGGVAMRLRRRVA